MCNQCQQSPPSTHNCLQGFTDYVRKAKGLTKRSLSVQSVHVQSTESTLRGIAKTRSIAKKSGTLYAVRGIAKKLTFPVGS